MSKAKITSIILAILTFICTPYLVYADDSTTKSAKSPIFTYGYLQEDGVRLRDQPQLTSNVIDNLYMNKKLLFRQTNDDWYEVICDGKTGYVYKDFIGFGLSSIKVEPVNTTTASTATTTSSSNSSSNTTSSSSVTANTTSTSNSSSSGNVLNSQNGTVYGPGGRETYYNLDMSGIVQIMQSYGYNAQYWVRDDGVKMYGDYIMVAADLSQHPRGSIVQTSLGTGMVCDTGGFVYTTDVAYDIATTW